MFSCRLLTISYKLYILKIFLLWSLSLPTSFPHAFLPDMDECDDGQDNCEQMCDNRLGTFICSCLSGYTLDSNDKNCTGK